MSQTSPSAADRSWPDYRAVWRWHFYAGLFCIPFVLVLSVTGAIYLFKTEIESWVDRPYDHLQVAGSPLPAADQVHAALAAVPGSTPSGYELPQRADDAVRVIVRKDGVATRVYVHPETLEVLHTVPENDRLMRTMFRLHGELLMGNRGSNLVELAASWTIVMLITGLFLWWPRQAKGWAGVAYPRLRSGSRLFWRDLHAVAGVWITIFALFLLLSGLPWAKFWGTYFKTVRGYVGAASPRQDWTIGSERSSPGGGDPSSSSSEHGDHVQGLQGRRKGSGAAVPLDLAAFDRIVATVRPLDLPPPVVIAPPSRGESSWTAKLMTPNRPLRVNLTIDGATGTITKREDFGDRQFLDRVVGVGIAAHEGRLFGWPNQLLGLLTAAGLILLSVSGVVMWWRRRDQGVLGAPRVLLDPRFSWGLVAIIVALGVYLPLFGASLVFVLLIERIVLVRIPGARNWLGLRSRRLEPAV